MAKKIGGHWDRVLAASNRSPFKGRTKPAAFLKRELPKVQNPPNRFHPVRSLAPSNYRQAIQDIVTLTLGDAYDFVPNQTVVVPFYPHIKLHSIPPDIQKKIENLEGMERIAAFSREAWSGMRFNHRLGSAFCSEAASQPDIWSRLIFAVLPVAKRNFDVAKCMDEVRRATANMLVQAMNVRVGNLATNPVGMHGDSLDLTQSLEAMLRGVGDVIQAQHQNFLHTLDCESTLAQIPRLKIALSSEEGLREAGVLAKRRQVPPLVDEVRAFYKKGGNPV